MKSIACSVHRRRRDRVSGAVATTTDWLAGDTVAAKSGAALIVSVTLVECVALGAVPVTVSV